MSEPSPTVSLPKSIILISVCISLFSCAPKPRVVLSLDEVVPFEGPVTVDVLREHIVLREIRTLRSEVRVRAESGRKRLGSYKGALVYARPDSVRLKLYGAFGAPGLDAVHSGGFLRIFFPQEKVLYEGPSPVSGDSLDYSMRNDGEEYVLYVFGEDDGTAKLRATYVFDRRTLLNKEVNYYSNGKRLLGVRFARYSNDMPLFAEIFLSNGYSMRAELIKPESDVEIPDHVFGPDFGHEGVKVLPLGRLLQGED